MASDQEKGKSTRRVSATREKEETGAIRRVPPAPIKVPEGGDANLRRRAEWLRQRHGPR